MSSLSAGCVLYWPCNEGSGVTIHDATGNAKQDGTIGGGQGADWAWRGTTSFGSSVGSSPESLDFAPFLTGNSTALSGAISTSSGPGWTSDRWTLAGWFNLLISRGSTSYKGCMYSRPSTVSPGWGIGYGSGAAPADQLGFNWFNGSEFSWNSGLVMPVGRWCFVAFQITPTAGTFYLFDQGVLSTASLSVSESAVTFNGAFFVANDSFGIRQFWGQVYGQGVWTRNLSIPEMWQLYNEGTPNIYPFGVRRMGRPLGSRIIVP